MFVTAWFGILDLNSGILEYVNAGHNPPLLFKGEEYTVIETTPEVFDGIDIVLASASKALVIGFNVRPDTQAKSLADQEHVDLRLYKVIYNVIDDIESAMKGMLDPIYEEKVIGHAEVRQTYKASGVGIIAGSYVLDGSVEREAKARITRGKDLIFEGEIGSLKRFKDDAKEVKAGYECGIVFEGFSDLREGDQIEVYKMVEVPRK